MDVVCNDKKEIACKPAVPVGAAESSKLKRYLLLTAGFTFLSIGFIGIFLPLLPTTPFLLLSAGCFFRSSERFYSWITNNKLFGAYIKNYYNYHAVSMRAKVFSLILLWAVMMISICLFSSLWLRLILACVALGVSIHILKIRTLTDKMLDEQRRER